MGQKILVVEDEKDLSRLLKYNLEKEGYSVLTASDGQAGLALFKKEPPDLILLDVMLPKMDGFEVCRLVRYESRVPIIFLSAKKEETDRVLGFGFGADDYMTKPFSVRELMARIKVILKRFSHFEEDRQFFKVGTLEVDLEKYLVSIKGKEIKLSAKEFSFLRQFLISREKVLSREVLLEKIYQYEESIEIDTRTVDQHVKRLRDKLGPESSRLLTIKNVGYRFVLD